MIDIEGTDKKVKQIDSLLTSIKTLLKKHWLFLMFVLLATFAYYVLTLPDDSSSTQTEQVAPDDNSDSTTQQ